MNIVELKKLTHSLKILYIKDDKILAKETMELFKIFFSHIVHVEIIEEGLNELTHNHYDCLIIDLDTKSKLNGLDLIKIIRQHNKTLPIIVYSEKSCSDTFLKSIEYNVDYFIIKPITYDTLLSSITILFNKIKTNKEQKEKEYELQQLIKLIDKSSIVSKANEHGIITYVNKNFENISLYSKKELLGQKHNIVRHPDMPSKIFKGMWKTIKDKKSIWNGVIKNKNKEGESYYTDAFVMPILDLDGNIKEYISFRNDITFSINHNYLLKDYLKSNKETFVVYFKIKNFEDIDNFYGNIISKKIESHLTNYFKKLQIEPYFFKVYNLENGNFVFIKKYTSLEQEKDVIEIIKNMQHHFNQKPIILNELPINLYTFVSISYGQNAFNQAKEGMKKNIEDHKNFIIHTKNNKDNKESFVHLHNYIEVSNEIKNALNKNAIMSYFQPIVNNITKEIEFYESLVRIQKDNGELIHPYYFLNISKQLGYYFQITEKILENSFKALPKTNKSITINLSAIDFENKAIQDKIFQLIKIYKEHTHKLVLEILEDENVKDINVISKFISIIKKNGIRIAIDDFGSGYSNFERIMNYQPDILKIDGNVIKNIVDNKLSLSIVKSISIFASENNIKLIGEFVENEAIYNILKAFNVEYSQGYYFGRPEKLF